MTTTPEGIDLAVETTNAIASVPNYTADDIATRFDTGKAAAQLATKLLAAQAKLAASDADWARVSDIAKHEGWQECGGGRSETAGIAARHRPEPDVDPLLIEAQELVAEWWEANPRGFSATATNSASILKGEADKTSTVVQALAAIRRGIELAKRGLSFLLEICDGLSYDYECDNPHESLHRGWHKDLRRDN